MSLTGKRACFMRKNLALAAAFAATMFCFSCTVEQTEVPAVEGEYQTFKAYVGTGDNARTSLDPANGKVTWAAGDAIKILWKTDEVSMNASSQALSASDISYDGSAVFKAVCEPSGSVFAVYPSSAEAEYSDYVRVKIPAVQDGSFSHNGILAANYTGDSFAFRQVCGFLQFSVPAGVTKVVWSADNVSPIAGTSCIDFPNGQIELNGIEDGVHDIEVNVPGAGQYYVAVAPGEYSSLYVASFDSEGSLVGEKQTFKQVSVARGQIKKKGTLPGDGTVLSSKYFVKSGGTGDGSSWDNAASIASLSSKVGTSGTLDLNVYMAAGTYTLSSGISFKKTGTIKVFGGYPADAVGESLVGRNVKANETILDGGGTSRLFVVTASSMVIDGLVFQNAYKNSTDVGAALIFQSAADQKHTVNNCILRNNKKEGTGPAAALRIAGAAAETVISNCVFDSNTSAANAGAVNVVSGKVHFVGNTFSNNSATTDAGAVNIEDGEVEFIGNAFTANTADADAGAVKIQHGLTVFKDNVFSGNISKASGTEAGGGAIKIGAAGAGTQLDVSFEGDRFEDNSAASASASAVYCKKNSATGAFNNYTVKFNNCVFLRNKAYSRGCVRSNSTVGKLYFNACTFASNSIAQYGNCIHMQTPSMIHNCVFFNNTNTSSTGAAVIYHDVNMLVTNTTIRLAGASTVALNHLGGVKSVIANNLIYNNGSNESGNAATAINIAKGKTLTSYGHNIIGIFNSGESPSPVTTANAADFVTQDAVMHGDHIYVYNNSDKMWKLDPIWVTAPHYLLKWTKWPSPGKPEGFELAAAERVEDAIDNFDTNASFNAREWLTEIGALNTDRRGTARSATGPIWPGSYDNSATSSL